MSEHRSPADMRQPLPPPPTCFHGCWRCPGDPESPLLCGMCRQEMGIPQTKYTIPPWDDLEPVYDFEPWPMNGP